jgi:hypothetical protein
MKTAMKLTVGAVMAVMIVPFFLVNGAQASRFVSYSNGASYQVTRPSPGSGNVQKTATRANGSTAFTDSRICANGTCNVVKSIQGKTYSYSY